METVSVYFVEAVGVDRIKIGKSAIVLQRFRDLQCVSPVELILLGTTTLYTEAQLHKQFEHLRCRGEWFFATKQLRSFIDHVLNQISSGRPPYFQTIDGVLERVRAKQAETMQAVEA